MKKLLPLLFLVMSLTSCTKIFTDYVPQEMVGEWEWEYSIVRSYDSVRGYDDTIYSKNLAQKIDFDGQIIVKPNGNIELISNDYNHLRLKNREMISTPSTYYSRYGLSKSYNIWTTPSEDIPPYSNFKSLKMQIEMDPDRMVVQGFPIDGNNEYAYNECAVLNKHQILYALNYFKKK